MNDFLKDLNREQYDAVVHTEGPVMVIAGAGAGKTRVLTYRIAYLLSKGVDAFNILSLTFTNKAAREMKERVIRLVGDNEGRNVWMGTFHAIFARILRIEGHYLGYPSNYSIYDSDDSKRLIRQVIKEKNLDNKVYSPSYIAHRISMAKSNLINAETYAVDPDIITADESAGKPLIKDIYKSYQLRLKRADAMDFDDLLFNTYILFTQFEKILYKYQQKFRYILVDEYQDTNHAQYLIINRLAARYENICVVGDDAQSIYGFRGAHIGNILNFKNDYPDHKLFKLEQNYRSTKNIVAAANKVITFNKDQIRKTVWTDNDEGVKIGFIRASSDNEEGSMVANAIFESKMNNQLPNDAFAILYRTNAQSRSLEEALRKLNINYKIYSGLSFYNRKEIKDLLAYIRLTINHNDEDALRRIINTPARGIGKTTFEKIIVAADNYNVHPWEVLNKPKTFNLKIHGGTLSRLDAFVTMIKSFKAELKKKDAFEVAKNIANSSGLIRMYREEDTPEGISRIENIEELLNAIKEFVEKGAEENEGDMLHQGTLEEFMQDVPLLTDADKDDDDTDKVSLMTIHSAKGLEFQHVFIVGLEENLFPSIQALGTRTDLEEERRLFYVALTRAMKKVTLSYAESRYRWGQFTITEPSRFLDEVDEELIDKPKRADIHPVNVYKGAGKKPPGSNFRELKKSTNGGNRQAAASFEPSDTSILQTGMAVEHPKFGKGKVVAVEGQGPNKKATVYFRSVGKKNLLLRFARLKIIS